MAEQWNRVVYASELGELGGVNLTNAAPTDIAEGAAAVGTSEDAARADHFHGYTAPDVPDAYAGAINAIDGGASDAGEDDAYARGDHAHGFAPLTALDFNKQEAQNLVLHNTSTAPSDPVIGQVYINPTDGRTYVWADFS